MGHRQGWFESWLALTGVSFGLLSSGCIACGGDFPDNGNASSCDPDPSGGTGGMNGGSAGLNLGSVPSEDGGRAGASVASCNKIELRSDAPAVTTTWTEAPAPAAMGGAIARGTYLYTAHIIYGSAAGVPMTLPPTQVSVSGDGWAQAVGFATGVRRSTSKLVTSGNTFTLTTTCPAGGSVQSGTYTATDTSIILYSESVSVVARVFTKQ